MFLLNHVLIFIANLKKNNKKMTAIINTQMSKAETNGMNLKNEKSLHKDIKKWYFRNGDRFEVKIEGKIIDIVRNDLLIEIQTQNLAAIKNKLNKLLDRHKIRTVYPLAFESTVITLDKKDNSIKRIRKSPKKENYIDIFDQLITVANLLAHKNFSLEILLIKQHDIRIADGTGSWKRRGVRLLDKQLIEVIDTMIFHKANDYLKMLPVKLPNIFTNKELATVTSIPVEKIRKITYCFRKMNLIKDTGLKQGRAILFSPSLV